jgi:hypothetical protein
MSDTPRSDLELSNWDESPPVKSMIELSRQVERELNAANAQIKELQATIQKLYKGAFEQQQRIKNIIQAGDKLYSSIYCGCGVDGPCKTCEQSTDLWDGIKELNT